MIEFGFPWSFALLPAPLAVYWLTSPYRERQESVQVPFFQRLLEVTGERPRRGAVIPRRIFIQRVLVLMSWLLLLCAAARPEWVGPPLSVTKSARDLMIAVDLSGSMEVRDFTGADGERLSRLDAVKQVLNEFVALREHDRLGLILFGDSPYLQAPFTEDHDTWLELLDETEIGMAGQSTMFGDAIGLAIKLFSASDSDNRVLIVLTDGNDTGSKVPPVDAAKVARAAGIRIYTIAIGDPSTVGEEALDLEVLSRVAQISEGGYYEALDRAQLERAYRKINELEPEEFETISYRPRSSLFHYPLAVMVVSYLVFHLSMGVLAWRRRGAAGHG